ncbi:unnamed protein product, partial [Porites evermanni]
TRPSCQFCFITSCSLLSLAQILEETHPSVHGSPFLAHDPETVGTFSVSPDPAGKVSTFLLFDWLFRRTAAALQRNTRPSTHDSPLPVYGQETVRPIPLAHYRAAEVPISVAHGFSEDTSLFSTHHHSAPSTIFTPGRSLGSEAYPGGSGMSTFTHPPKKQEFCSPYEMLRRPLHGLQPQTTIPSAFNLSGLGVSTVTHPLRIQEAPIPPLHGLQHQSTIADVPNLTGYGLSTDTLQPQIPGLRASYETPSPSLHEVQPHHTFPDASYLSGSGLSTVTHPLGLSGRSSPFGTIRPPQYELQPQSVIPGDPHLSDPARSSV